MEEIEKMSRRRNRDGVEEIAIQRRGQRPLGIGDPTPVTATSASTSARVGRRRPSPDRTSTQFGPTWSMTTPKPATCSARRTIPANSANSAIRPPRDPAPRRRRAGAAADSRMRLGTSDGAPAVRDVTPSTSMPRPAAGTSPRFRVHEANAARVGDEEDLGFTVEEENLAHEPDLDPPAASLGLSRARSTARSMRRVSEEDATCRGRGGQHRCSSDECAANDACEATGIPILLFVATRMPHSDTDVRGASPWPSHRPPPRRRGPPLRRRTFRDSLSSATMTDSRPPISVAVDGRPPFEVPPGTLVADLPGIGAGDGPLAWLGALVNNDVVSLSYPLEVDSQGRAPDPRATPTAGASTAAPRPSCSPRPWRAVPGRRFASSTRSARASTAASAAQRDGRASRPSSSRRSRTRMRELVERDLPIERRKIAFTEAVGQFEREKQWDKYNLLRFRNPAKIVAILVRGVLRPGPRPPGGGHRRAVAVQAHPLRPRIRPPVPRARDAQTLAAVRAAAARCSRSSRSTRSGAASSASTPSAASTRSSPTRRSATSSGSPRPSTRRRSRTSPTTSLRAASTMQVDPDRGAVVLRQDHVRQAAGRPAARQRPAAGDDLGGQLLRRTATRRRGTRSGEPDFENIETLDLAAVQRAPGASSTGARRSSCPHFNFEQGEREFQGEKLRHRAATSW